MKFFAIGEDKSLMDITDLVLALAGGVMTGNISYQGSNATGQMIRFLDNTVDGYGNGISIGGGGLMLIGSGESAQAVEGIEQAGNEKTIIASDQEIEFYTNVQSGIDSAAKVTLSKTGMLSGHQKAITSGTAAPSGGSNGDIYIQY